MINRKKLFIFLLLSLFIIGTCFFSYCTYKNFQETKKRKIAWGNLKIAVENRIKNIRGETSIVIKDFNTDWEIAFNKNTLVPSASLVKIPIMLSCFYAAEEKKVTLEDTIYLKASEKVEGSKVLEKKPAGSIFTVEQLIEPMITQSDNTATNMLIDFLGFDTLNAYFRKIGLKNTNIARKMVDFKKRKEGVENYTTAQDMAFILEILYHNKFLNKRISRRCLLLLGQQKINDRIPRGLPKDKTFIAHKTGLEKNVCHDVGIAFTKKGNFLICALVKHKNHSADLAKKLISDIALLTYSYYQSF